MARITKAMLETDVRILHEENRRLREEIWRLKEVNELLKTRQFDVGGFCKMHAEAVSAITHTVADLRIIIKERK